MEDKVKNLVLELSKKVEELNQLNKIIDNLKKELKSKTLEEENESLKLIHQLCENDISEYNEQIKSLEENIKSNSDVLNNLRKENENLKKAKNVQREDIEDKKSLTEIKRISKKYGLKLFKRLLPSLSEEFEKEKEEIPKNVLEKYLRDYYPLYQKMKMKKKKKSLNMYWKDI